MKIITTVTTVTNRIAVEDGTVEGLSEEEIAATISADPEAFGRDDDPVVEADQFISIEDIDAD